MTELSGLLTASGNILCASSCYMVIRCNVVQLLWRIHDVSSACKACSFGLAAMDINVNNRQVLLT